MNKTNLFLVLAALSAGLSAQEAVPCAASNTVAAAAEVVAAAPVVPAADAVRAKLEAGLADLAALRTRIADEKIPLARSLAQAEEKLSETRRQYDTVKRQADGRTLEAAALRNEIKQRETERNYLSSLFGEYVRNFETRLHVSELELYKDAIETARLAPDRLEKEPAAAFGDQLRLVFVSLARIEEIAGGMTFPGRAAGADGLVKAGRFMLFGPMAYFLSDDGMLAGIAAQRVGSLIPVIEPYDDPAQTELLRNLFAKNEGLMPFDATLGNACKVEEMKETLKEHFLKGGPVMWPMLWLMLAALLVVVLKWLGLTFVRMPRAKALAALLDAVREKDTAKAVELAAKLPGPAGRMLRTGVSLLNQPKELIEEAMFEKMLDTRSRLNRFLPFVAVSAACAPLLGLLGTVTGIISTFKLMTLFGSGDIKMLSSGISEALITTEYGLYIAIPSVLFHSFLSRKAKGLADRMEQIAIRFMGEIGKV